MRRSKESSSADGGPDALTAPQPSRLRIPAAVLVAIAIVLVVAGFALGRIALSASSGRMVRIFDPAVQVGGNQSTSVSSGISAASAGAGMVEVPELVGMRVDEAVVVLETAGFRIEYVDAGGPVAVEASRVVQSQRPGSGTVLSVDSTVSITVPPYSALTSATASMPKKKPLPRLVVCIDPGHQAHSDVKLEPIGPGSKIEKPRATGGSTGVTSGVPEYELALQISMNLKWRLEAAGIRVVMTRTTNDVTVPNSERAKIANRAKADLFVRVHGSVSTNPADSGITTLYPAKNRWTQNIVAPSRRAARTIEQAVCRTTGATSRGARTQTGVAGFNWSKVPSVVVETGFLSNPLEDKLMSGPSYQDELAQGITDGVLAYLNGAR